MITGLFIVQHEMFYQQFERRMTQFWNKVFILFDTFCDLLWLEHLSTDSNVFSFCKILKTFLFGRSWTESASE